MRLKDLRLPIFIFLVIIFFSLTSCTAEETRPTLAPVVDTSTPPPTATVQSPPRTPTSSPFPSPPPYASPIPTPLPPREVEIPLMADDFRSAAAWNTIETSGSSVFFNENRITIAIKEPHSYIFSLRNAPTMDDFCAEIDIHPVLCEGEDAYGFVFRSNGISSYRYALTCDGKVRFDLREIFESPLVLRKASPSDDALRGYPGKVRLGVCAAGAEMAIFYS